jgi:hypothetical protein
MGKNRVIKTLIKFVSNIVEHKIVFKYGEMQDAKHFVDSEIAAYRDSAIGEAGEYNWNNSEKEVVLSNSIKMAREGLKNDYPDVSFSESDLQFFANETMKEVFG